MYGQDTDLKALGWRVHGRGAHCFPRSIARPPLVKSVSVPHSDNDENSGRQEGRGNGDRHEDTVPQEALRVQIALILIMNEMYGAL